MASIFKRDGKSGAVWYLSYTINGKRVKKKIGKSKKIAEIALKEIEVKLAKNEIGIVEHVLKLDMLIKEYMDSIKARNSTATVTRYLEIIGHFKRFLKENHPHIRLTRQVNQKIVEEYVAMRNKIRKSKTVNDELTVLKAIFNMAVRREYVRKSPLQNIKPLKERDSKPPQFLTREQIEKVLDSCKDESFKDVLVMYLHTGMRKGELVLLEWANVDFNNSVINVVNWKTYRNSLDKYRVIPMSAKLEATLKKIRKLNRPGKFVFTDEEVGRHNKNYLRNRFMRLTRKCGMPEFTSIHSLRHTFASHLVMKGVDLATVQKLMGHASIETTMKYAHLAPDHLRAAIKVIDY